MNADELQKFIETKSVSSNRSFDDSMRESLKNLFIPLMEEGIFLRGCEVDTLLSDNLPTILALHGSVRCRNKYREIKARFIKKNK